MDLLISNKDGNLHSTETAVNGRFMAIETGKAVNIIVVYETAQNLFDKRYCSAWNSMIQKKVSCYHEYFSPGKQSKSLNKEQNLILQGFESRVIKRTLAYVL